MTFRVGQKVALVGTGSWKAWRGTVDERPKPRHGVVYTVREIEFHFGLEWLVIGFGTDGFDARDFRPVVERKTDISIFTKTLTDKTLEVVR